MNSHDLARTLLTLPDTPVLMVGAYGKTQPLADVRLANPDRILSSDVLLRVAQQPRAKLREAGCGWGHGDRCPCTV